MADASGRRLRCPWCVGHLFDGATLEHVEPACETFAEVKRSVREMPTEVLGRFPTMPNAELEHLVDAIRGRGRAS